MLLDTPEEKSANVVARRTVLYRTLDPQTAQDLWVLPMQGDRKPWRLHQNYLRDLVALRWGRVDDGVMGWK